MIGIFDSGLGGLQSLEYIRAVLPQVRYVYLGDTKYVPYGDKSPAFLRERTFQCLHWLFAQWCTLVILACNTASAYAIRARQQQFPEKKVLSVTLPGIEAIVQGGYDHVGLLATAATLESNLYPDMMQRHFPDYQMHFTYYNGSWLVELLEQGNTDDAIRKQLRAIFDSQQPHWEALILGSTHYPLLKSYIQELFWSITFIDPAQEAAKKLPAYLLKHTDLVIETSSVVSAYVTGSRSEEYGVVTSVEI